MARWVRLFDNQYLGFFALGLALFALQELPYIVMPLIPMTSNPLMEMHDKSAVLSTCELVLMVSCVVAMLFLVHGDAKWFSLDGPRERVFFVLTVAALLAYWVGWAFYFAGHQSLWLILGLLVAMPPLYYASIGAWRRNWVLAGLGTVALGVHLANVSVNLV